LKHLLIIFSILLLSSFLTSCEKKEGTLYFWETSSGYEWKEIGDKDTQIQYRGFVDYGYPEGLGVMTFPTGEKYVGEFKDGKIWNGQGTFTFPDGRKYVGEFKDGKQHGKGTLTSRFEKEYIGEFKEGTLWNITEYDKNGNILGKWVNGKLKVK